MAPGGSAIGGGDGRTPIRPITRRVSRSFDSASLRADAAAKASKGRTVPVLEPGDKVTHDSFGLGTVVAVDGSGQQSTASIDFGSAGVKRLLLRYAPVEKL